MHMLIFKTKRNHSSQKTVETWNTQNKIWVVAISRSENEVKISLLCKKILYVGLSLQKVLFFHLQRSVPLEMVGTEVRF